MKYYYILFILLGLFSGCTFLDVVPEGDIEDIDMIFERREQTENWFKVCHSWLSPFTTSVISNPAYMGTDEVVAGNFMRQQFAYAWSGLYIADGLQMSHSPYCNMWRKDAVYCSIRYCNTFLEKIGGVFNMTDEEKALWAAEIKALKAHYYFELLRHYGPFVLVPENIAPNADIDEMKQPRRPVDECVETIVSLLDEAMKDLPPLNQKEKSRWAYHSLESAAALKAMTLFYAASPLFNGNSMYTNFTNRQGEKLFNPTKDPEKWKRAAIATDTALAICLRNGKYLETDGGGTLKNVISDIEKSTLARNFENNNEAIFMFRHENLNLTSWTKWTRPHFLSTDKYDFNNDLLGCVAPSIKMVEMYYTEHGLPINEDKEWDYSSRYKMGTEKDAKYKDIIASNDDVLRLHLRREPRFYAHIAADRCYFYMGPKNGNVQSRDIVKARRGERFGTQYTSINNSNPQNLTGYWMKKGSDPTISNKGYEQAFSNDYACILIRLAELYLMKAEAWNEYLEIPDQEHVYQPLNEVRRRAGIPDVEEAWQTYALHPEKVRTKEGMREIIHQEWDVEFAFEGRRFWNLRRWLNAEEYLNEKQYGWNITGETAQQFYNNFEGPVVVWSKRQFIPQRDYLFPIRSEEIMISGCVQNPGW